MNKKCIIKVHTSNINTQTLKIYTTPSTYKYSITQNVQSKFVIKIPERIQRVASGRLTRNMPGARTPRISGEKFNFC